MTLLQRDRENIELGREEGLNRALEDPDFRNRLFEEYNIL